MRSRVTLSVCVLLLVALGGYAGQRQRADFDARGRDAVKRAVRAQQARPGFHTLSYEGRGTLMQRTDGAEGLYFNPGETLMQLMMGFPIEWRRYPLLTAADGTPITEVAGRLKLAYDPETGLLDVSLTDDAGQELHGAYQPKGFERADPFEFAAFVDDFFQFMNTDVDRLGAVAAVGCTVACTFGTDTCGCAVQGCAASCTLCECSCTPTTGPNGATCRCICIQGSPTE